MKTEIGDQALQDYALKVLKRWSVWAKSQQLSDSYSRVANNRDVTEYFPNLIFQCPQSY